MKYLVVSYKDKNGEWRNYKTPGPYTEYSYQMEVEDGNDNMDYVKQRLENELGYMPTHINFYRTKRGDRVKNEGFKHGYKVEFTVERDGKVLKHWELHEVGFCNFYVYEDSYPKAYAKAMRKLKQQLGESVKITNLMEYTWEDKNGTNV